jgi:NAD(P)-dependent dehydrogenase (short-subunit alcohol dehydrogenase family)
MDQKVALITGCSSGFGLLTAVDMARSGFRVVATMRNLGKREALDKAAKDAGVALDVRALDITKFETLDAFVADVVRDFGRIDVLVNNAGFSVSGFAEDLTLAEIKLNFETNFFGHVAMTKAVLPVMRKQKSGHIIMVSSMAGLIAQPVVSTYCATKHALEGWSEAVRIETHSLGIRIVLVEPGAFATNIWEENVIMGEHCTSPESPNLERSLRFRDFVRNNVAKADAREVSQLIVRVAQDPNPKLRYLIGRDAHAAYWMKRITPWKRWERMVAKHTKIDV